MSENWYSIQITVRPDAAEALEFAFNSLDASGTAISFTKVGSTDELTVSGFFEELPDSDRVQDELHFALRAYGLTEDAILDIRRGAVENEDWLAEWKKHWRPTTIGRFVIAPPWAEVETPEAIVIRIEPNMAFGTGTHDTTQLCIFAIDRFYEAGDSFLDVGTGTGILAIAAAKLSSGGEAMLAIDTDEDSIAIARQNAESNGTQQIRFEVGAIGPGTPRFDFVCANLTADVILPIIGELIERTNRMLVLSGILLEQEPMIVAGLRTLSVDDPKIERSGEWISVIVRKTC